MDEAKRAALTARLPHGTRIVGMSLLSGGAIQQNWALDVEINGQPAQWVLRTDSTATLTHSRPRSEEFALLKAAFAAGVTVPEPLLLCDDTRVIGAPFFIMRRVHGTAAIWWCAARLWPVDVRQPSQPWGANWRASTR